MTDFCQMLYKIFFRRICVVDEENHLVESLARLRQNEQCYGYQAIAISALFHHRAECQFFTCHF